MTEVQGQIQSSKRLLLIIYLGPMTTGLIFIMILISNTVIYLPL